MKEVRKDYQVVTTICSVLRGHKGRLNGRLKKQEKIIGKLKKHMILQVLQENLRTKRKEFARIITTKTNSKQAKEDAQNSTKRPIIYINQNRT